MYHSKLDLGPVLAAAPDCEANGDSLFVLALVEVTPQFGLAGLAGLSMP